MKSIILIFIFLSMLSNVYGQFEKEKKAILEEGFLLYRMEKASWKATDLLFEKYGEYQDKLGGYISYIDKKETKTIFWSREKDRKVLFTFSFDEKIDEKTVSITNSERELSQLEADLVSAREKALKEMQSDTAMFKMYEEVNPNPVLLSEGKEIKVFIISGAKENGYVPLGNDYLLIFRKGELKSKEKLHNNLILIPAKSKEGEEKIKYSFHGHKGKTSELITSTDICTLLLYKDFVEWKQHYVISAKYVSIFDLDTANLIIMTKEAFDKIGKKD